MKAERLTELICHPEKIEGDDLQELSTLVNRYPYFLAARILYLKALNKFAHIEFQNELKSSTIHIIDHKQFYRYLNNLLEIEHWKADSILSEEINYKTQETLIETPLIFESINIEKVRQSNIIDDDTINIEFIPTTSTKQDITKETNQNDIANKSPLNNTETSLSTHSQSEEETFAPMELVLDDEEEQVIQEDEKEIKSIIFDTPEIIGSIYQLEGDQEDEQEEIQLQELAGLLSPKKKFNKNEIIDQFITREPGSIKVNPNTADIRDLSKEFSIENEELFTETLAKIYVKQKLYEKAITTYIKLSLKYPEKSVYFADRIEKIKENINNNE